MASDEVFVTAEELIQRIGGALDVRSPQLAEPGTFDTEAAVSLLIRPTSERLDFLAIKRTESARDPWSGHMALPGGRRLVGDGST